MKLFLCCLFAAAATLHAGPRTSASYTVAIDTADAGGRRVTSTNYTNDGSAGLIAGVSSVASPAETAKQGYIAQLFDVTGLVVSAAASSVNETGTLQLSAQQLLDDSTFLAVPATSVTWGVVSGPIAGINAAGLATAGPVFQATPASVQGVFAGNTGSLNLTVLDTIFDNFGTYAADGLGDDWQVQHFGQPPNANAGPLIDPDHDGHDNRFEFISGIIPTDGLSVFNLRIDPVPGFPTQKKLIFSPRFVTRTYTVKTATTLGTPMSTLTGSTTSDNGNERTVTDTSTTGGAKFYSVEIVKP